MKENKIDFSKYYQTCVRFSEKEYFKIKKQAHLTGFSIPQFLKEIWREIKFEEPKISNEEVRSVIRELGHIGNNVNQIARWVNSGSYYGDLSELKDWKERLIKALDRLK